MERIEAATKGMRQMLRGHETGSEDFLDSDWLLFLNNRRMTNRLTLEAANLYCKQLCR